MRWLVKTDPALFAWEDLEASSRTTWNRVRNSLALRHLRRMQRGEDVLLYHAGGHSRIVGLARVARSAYLETRGEDVVDLEAVRPFEHPVARSALVALPRLQDWELVRIPRLTVLPVPNVAWRAVMRLSTGSGTGSTR